MSRISLERVYPSFKSFACEAFLISSRKSQSSEAISGEEVVSVMLFSDIRTDSSHISLPSFSFAMSWVIFAINAEIIVVSVHFFRICVRSGRLFCILLYQYYKFTFDFPRIFLKIILYLRDASSDILFKLLSEFSTYHYLMRFSKICF